MSKTQRTTQYDWERATHFRAAEGRVPGFFLFSWSPVVGLRVDVDPQADPNTGAREAVDRLFGVMGHAGMKFLAEQVLPEGTGRYVSGVDQGVWLDGGLFVPYSPKAAAQLAFLFRGSFLHLKFPAAVVEGPHYDEEAIGRWLSRHFPDQAGDAEGDGAELEMLCQKADGWDFPAEALPVFERTVDALFTRFCRRIPYEERKRMEDGVAEFVEIVAPDFERGAAPGNQVDVRRFAQRYLAMLRHENPDEAEEMLLRKAAAFTTARVDGMDRYRLVKELSLWDRRLPSPAANVHEAVTVSLNEWLIRQLTGRDE